MDSINDHKAEAAITDSDVTASLEFEFNEKGEIISIYIILIQRGIRKIRINTMERKIIKDIPALMTILFLREAEAA